MTVKRCDWWSLQLTRIDGQYFLEILLDSVVFVNDVRVKVKMLADGARITLGGAQKSHQQGSRFPAAYVAGPHLVYEYRVGKDHSLTGVYKDPVFRSDELIRVEEVVGAPLSCYHTEDFNMTQVATACILSLIDSFLLEQVE